jgi:hypothetical protein
MNTAATAKRPFVVQMREFFGFLPGHGIREFSGELKALSQADKIEFAAMLTDAGFPCDAPITLLTAA